MACITANNKFVSISTGNSALIWSESSSVIRNIVQPLTLQSEDNRGNDEKCTHSKRIPMKGQTSLEHEERHMACVALSPCGQWLALASSRGQKQIGLWSTVDWSMVSARAMSRAASCVRFTPSGRAVLVADKSGDIYLYSVTEPTKEKEWLLGHVAMLLDILITPDEKFLISCDRDEKIRVSCFPNTYNIHSYCLGHEMFVSSLIFLPHNFSILVSTSGDGSLQLWDYKNGRRLCYADVQEQLKTENAPDNSPLAVKTCVGLQLDSSSSLLCVCIGSLPLCAVFRVTEGDEHDLSLSLVQRLQLTAELWSLTFTPAGQLLTFCRDEKQAVTCWYWEHQQSSFVSSQHPCMDLINSQWDILKCCFVNASVPSMLYRRKYADDGEKSVVPTKKHVNVAHS